MLLNALQFHAVFQYETTADQHSLLNTLTDNQSSMTVKPMDVQPFASVQPDEALMSNLQDNSEQSNKSSVVSKVSIIYYVNCRPRLWA